MLLSPDLRSYKGGFYIADTAHIYYWYPKLRPEEQSVSSLCFSTMLTSNGMHDIKSTVLGFMFVGFFKYLIHISRIHCCVSLKTIDSRTVDLRRCLGWVCVWKCCLVRRTKRYQQYAFTQYVLRGDLGFNSIILGTTTSEWSSAVTFLQVPWKNLYYKILACSGPLRAREQLCQCTSAVDLWARN